MPSTPFTTTQTNGTLVEQSMPPNGALPDELAEEESNHHDIARRHPLGVRPSGNALTADQNSSRYMGLFGRLPDALVLTVLEYLDASSLVHIGGTCRALFAYSTFDQLWRDIVVNQDHAPLEKQDQNHTFAWRGSWRASQRHLSTANLPRVDCSNVFSDALHRPFLCSQIPLSPFVSSIPHQNQIARLNHMSADVFNQQWSDRPFILTEPVKRWRVYQKWGPEELLNQYGDVVFRAEAVDWPLRAYIEYMNATEDESPLYLFDRSFVEKMKLEVGSGADAAFQPPECFQEDLFMLLKEQRPDHRWLIIGPERSGSTFHKDPNATSAWNAVIRGSKYWIMFPASVLPPGVYMSDDQSEVTSPLSIAEWLLSFHAEARQTLGCIEGICQEGEVLHVPSGWWHLVVNLAPSIAITQNFVPRSHVGAAVRFLRYKANQVSGFKEDVTDPGSLFMQRLKEFQPEIAASLDDSIERKRKWEEVVEASDEYNGRANGGFSFGFDDDIDDEEDG